jgi:hypothetical protein
MDAMWTGGGVVDRAEEEVKSPAHIRAGEMRQHLAKRIDERGA